MTDTKITKRSTMREVLESYPSAQRALFRRFHIGGCNSCGYQPDDILEEVAHRHNIIDLDEVIGFIEYAEQIDRRIQVSPQEVAAALRGDNPPRLVDVRSPQEWEVARIQGATLITEALVQVMMDWPKDSPVVFYCHLGQRSLGSVLCSKVVKITHGGDISAELQQAISVMGERRGWDRGDSGRYLHDVFRSFDSVR